MKKNILILTCIMSLSLLFTACNKQTNIEYTLDEQYDLDNVSEEVDDGILTDKVSWATDIYEGDYDRDFLRQFTKAFTEIMNENKQNAVTIFEIEYVPTGTCGNEECIEMYKVTYRYYHEENDAEPVEYLYVIINVKSVENKTVENGYTYEYTLLDYMSYDEMSEKYNKEEYLREYDDMYQAACMESKK